jgi:hypothetical protein
MSIQETIRKVLKEEVDSIIEKYVNKYYVTNITVEYNDRYWGYTVTINLQPKDKETEKYGEIYFYSTWKIINGRLVNYDTNSVDNGGVFRMMGLVNELNTWLYKKSKDFVRNKYGTVIYESETTRKLLREELSNQIINRVVRRLKNIDELILQSTIWTSNYYKERLKDEDMLWFIETVIDGFYIDNISPIFELWYDDDGQLEPVMSITDDEEEELRMFFQDKYYDKIAEYYENNISKSIIKEEIEMPLSIRRRIKMGKDDIINYLRKFAIMVFEPDVNIERIVKKSCWNTAYEILDSTHTHIDDNTFYKLEEELTDYLKNKYGEQIKEFIRNYFNEGGDNTDKIYQFWKHAERNGGNGFNDSFTSWNGLLKKYGTWFPSLDWVDIKEKLDSMEDNKPLLIVEPGDKFNSMNYYFSLIKIARKK